MAQDETARIAFVLRCRFSNMAQGNNKGDDMSKTPIVDAEILKMKAALRNYPEYDRIFEQYQSMRDLARELEVKLAAEQANRTWQPIATAPQGTGL